MNTQLDHIAVTAPTLARGVEFVGDILGVAPQQGGAHPRMGTHNLLLRLGPANYLEVIAPDPQATRPDRPRWFELDQLAPTSPPRLAAWVARTDDIVVASAACAALAGKIESMSRGAWSWRITIPPDGSLPLGGAAPALIQWEAGPPHPAAALDDTGCVLAGLDIFHPDPQRIQDLLAAIGFCPDTPVRARAGDDKPQLVAHIQTPRGLRALPTWAD